MGMHGNIVSFNAGELTPMLSARADIGQYASGCKTLENFFVTSYGPATRRTGTEYLTNAKFADRPCRLVPFVYSTETNYILEFSTGYIRFSRDGAHVMTSANPPAIYEIASPYTTDLHLLKWVQSADVLFIVHPSHYPRMLSRLTETTFEIKELPMTGETTSFAAVGFPAMQDPNITETTITASALTGDDITLTASEDLFLPAHIGSYWDIIHVRQTGNVEGNLASATVSSSLRVLGAFNFITRGSWSGTVALQKSLDRYKVADDASATWYNFRSYSSVADRNFDVSGSEKDSNVYYRVNMTAYVSGTCSYELRNDNFYNHGIVKITEVNVLTPTLATADVIIELGATTATSDWSEGAWGDIAGYPRAIALYEERLWFAGTDKQPNTIWGSKTGEWNNFQIGDLADDALMLTLTGDINIIQWLLGQNALLIGTAFSEWILTSSADDKPITSSDFKIKMQSGNGSGYLPAMIIGDTALYVQKNNRKVQEFAYNFQDDKYKSNDLTILSNLITKVEPMEVAPIAYGITEIAYQRQPETILWAVRADGVALTLTYQREQSVVGWARHITDGEFESIAVIPGDLDDEVYAAVKRTVSGTDVRYIEKFSSREWQDMNNANFADCAIRVTPTAISPSTDKTLCSGLLHLAGKTVCIVADGSLRTSQVVSTAGTITLDAHAETAMIGLPYTSRIVPMPLNIQLQDGTNQFRPTRISNVKIKVYKSIGGKVKTGNGEFREINTRRVSDEVNIPLPPYSGWFTIVCPGGWTEETDIEIIQDQPLPLTVINLSPVFEVH